nr:WYL domain-containing protein [Caldimonas mangrovi]
MIWEGRVSRARLMELFGLSATRASEWLKELKVQRPDWVEWDSKRRSLTATKAAYRDVERSHPSASAVPIHESLGDATMILPWEFSRLSPYTFSRLRMAIKDRRQVSFNYMSMSRPVKHRRVVEPHSIVRAGRRWHVRGYCLERGDFRDFVLGRMTDVSLTDEAASHEIGSDSNWNRIVKVRLVAHPSLTDAQSQVVRQEYFSGTAARVTTCRGPLVPYLIQELKVATDLDRQLPPDYQLALDNREECKEWLFPT